MDGGTGVGDVRKNSEKRNALATVTVFCGAFIAVLGSLFFLLVLAFTWHLVWAAQAMAGFDAVIFLYWLVMCVGILVERPK